MRPSARNVAQKEFNGFVMARGQVGIADLAPT